MRAPQTVVFPYCVFTIVECAPDYTFKEEAAEATLQFSIFDKAPDNSSRSVATLLDAQAKLWALYDFARPSVPGHSVTIMRRVRSLVLHEGDTGVSQSMTQYMLRISKINP
jgi:hypothetical protein